MEIKTTLQFQKWLKKLRNRPIRAYIITMINEWRENGLVFGDIKKIGSALYESRIHKGPGYRVYFTYQGARLVILLVGGDKSTQESDIRKSLELLNDMEDYND
ncbi:type II toxin-antitoxin system RelE/ParE family toxin [Alloscardovia omnicolens]|uniref:type II toxin-antitoxin system RelE/ParE family toxin n=1 Tax=Alloscardovia omnicolens TaxID=419015 RepID=UPI003A5D6A33